MSKNEELCIKNEKLCIKIEELCSKNDEFCRQQKWAGGVYSPDSGMIYAIPYSASSVLIVDPTTDTADSITLTIKCVFY